MIKLDTTFVVGAGASVDYGFPLGEALTKQIADALNFNGSGNDARELIRSAIDVIGRRPDAQYTPRELFEQAMAMRVALATHSSIDTFLETFSGNRHFELLGKYGIAACLATAECRCDALKPGRRGDKMNLARAENSWLARLFKTVLAPGISIASIEQIFAHVSFVVFNYDRCIEHYFEHAIASHFMVDPSAASRIVQKHLRIVHPYGDLGALHGTAANMPFGETYDFGTYAAADAIDAMSKRILTFSESKKAQGADAQTLIGNAKRLVFLGFGFGDQNVELLRPPTSVVQDVRATVMNLSSSSQREVQRRIALMTNEQYYPDNTDLHNGDCTSMINDEQMFLTRSF